MIKNERIDYFPFNTPVTFIKNPGQTILAKLGWQIGSMADRYASLNKTTVKIDAERIDAKKIYFKTDEVKTVPLWISVVKVASYILSVGTLPLIALVIKHLFKKHLNATKVLTKNGPNEVFYEKQIGKSKIVLLYGDLTKENTDAIVNAANTGLFAGGGVCGAIHSAAGNIPFDECKKIKDKQNRAKIDCGEAVITNSGKLAPQVRAIVHAAGPNYNDPAEKAEGKELLHNAYWNSLMLTTNPSKDYVSDDLNISKIQSIAFPSISTSIFKAPLEEAAPVALKTVQEFLKSFPNALEEVRFVFLPAKQDPETGVAYKKALEAL